jgi:hypothetical protein
MRGKPEKTAEKTREIPPRKNERNRRDERNRELRAPRIKLAFPDGEGHSFEGQDEITAWCA